MLLLGDASIDPRNFLGAGDNDLVPTKLMDVDPLQTASDDWFADFGERGVAEMAIGRIPARTLAEAHGHHRQAGRATSGPGRASRTAP